MPVSTTDSTVADAMNRVLEAEREVAAAIVAAETQAEATLQAARETRRRLLETARNRASRVHLRAQSRLATALAGLDAGAHSREVGREHLETVAQEAIDRLARRLASVSHEPA